jgi:phenylalanine-4-hydroxylase
MGKVFQGGGPIVRQATWRQLCVLQWQRIRERACDAYLVERERLAITEHRIPTLAELDRTLFARTGWRVVRVNGYVQPARFFQMLAAKEFPCMDVVRHAQEMLYTSEPDMFHDVMGHLPMLANPAFGEYYLLFGRAGLRARHEEHLVHLDRIYWFTMEFGIINPAPAEAGQARVYGAGLMTAPTEILTCLTGEVPHEPFSVSGVRGVPVDIRKPNEVLFEITSFENLAAQFEDWACQEQLL